jgi:hypothetical protein
MKYDFGKRRKHNAVANGNLRDFTRNDFIISLHKSDVRATIYVGSDGFSSGPHPSLCFVCNPTLCVPLIVSASLQILTFYFMDT